MLKLKSLLSESKALLLELDKSTNIASYKAKDAVDQLAKENGTGNTELGKVMIGSFKFAPGSMKFAETPGKRPMDMVKAIGRDKLIARIEKVQGQVKSAKPGLSKAEMPALEGGDAKNVADALSDEAGQIAVDLKGDF